MPPAWPRDDFDDTIAPRGQLDLCGACDGANVPTPLLGVAVKLLTFNGAPNAAAGFGLIGMGTEPTSVLYDPVTGGGGPPPNAP